MCQLNELQLVLSWVLVSVGNHDTIGKKKMTRLSPLPFSQLLVWIYAATKYWTGLVDMDEKTREVCDNA